MEKLKSFFTWQAILAIGVISVIAAIVYSRYIAPKIASVAPASN